MNFFSENKVINVDFNQFSLNDIVQILEQEDYFTTDSDFFILEKIDNNHFIFGIDGNKVMPRTKHEFRYYKADKRLEIRGTYDGLYFPYFVFFIIPIGVLYLNRENQTPELSTFLLKTTFFISVLNVFIIFTGIRGRGEVIERSLFIRLNAMLRQKGIGGML